MEQGNEKKSGRIFCPETLELIYMSPSLFVLGCLSEQSCNASVYLSRLTNFVCLVI
jgi:hypothetical protein